MPFGILQQTCEGTDAEAGLKGVSMYFYIFQNTKTNMIKFGITENIARRKAQLERACGVELWEVAWTETHAAESFESFIMDLYGHYRCVGEWFDIPVENRDNIEDAYESLAKYRHDYSQLVFADIWGKDKNMVFKMYCVWLEDEKRDSYTMWNMTPSDDEVLQAAAEDARQEVAQ